MYRALYPIAAIACLTGAFVAQAAEQMPYSPAAMKAAQDAGRPVIVDVTAILREPKFKSRVLLHVDFDKQKQALHTFNVRSQSTFVAFKGKEEVGRSTGDTDKASIEKLFDKTS